MEHRGIGNELAEYVRSAGKISNQAIETTHPPVLVLVTSGLIVNALVQDDDLGALVSGLESNRHAFGRVRCRPEAPRVDESARGLDELEDTLDPNRLPVGSLVRNSVSASDAQIDLGARAPHGLRAPPFLELRRGRPRSIHAFDRRAER